MATNGELHGRSENNGIRGIDTYVVKGRRYLGFYEVHSVLESELDKFRKLQRPIVTSVQGEITTGRRVAFLLEEGTPHRLAQDTYYTETLLRSGRVGALTWEKYFDHIEELLKAMPQDDEERKSLRYGRETYRLLAELQNQHGAQRVWGILEKDPGTEHLVSDLISAHLGFLVFGSRFLMDHLIQTYIDHITNIATRDLKVAGQAIKEYSRDRVSIVVRRGAGHLGLSTAIKVLAKNELGDGEESEIDTESPITITTQKTLKPVMKILWQEKFWSEAIKRSKLNAKKSMEERELRKFFIVVQEILKESLYFDRLKKDVGDIVNSYFEDCSLTLTQE